eukprot:2868815-Prymnesium_polylepis.1
MARAGGTSSGVWPRRNKLSRGARKERHAVMYGLPSQRRSKSFSRELSSHACHGIGGAVSG